MAARTFTANFIGRTSNLEKSFKRVSKGSATMSDNLIRTTRMAGLGFAALGGVVIGAAAALKPMIDKAASMEEALSKNQLLLGESSKAVEAFADTSLESFGVTNLAALQATGVFASLGDAMGMSEEASASMATTLTGLAGDLSSLHDVDVETALTALRAGLIGEAEPLRKLGILLDAATIKSKALAMGLVENTKDALTPAIKSQAAYALILEKGATAMGDFARTADSATNVSKQLAGQWEEMQIVIGTALLPAFTALVTHLVDVVMPAITDFFEDPTWTQGALLAGQAAQNNLVKGFAGFTLALGGAILSPAGFIFGQLKDLAVGSANDAAQEALAAAVGAAGAAGAFDRPTDVRDGGGGGGAVTDIFAAVAALEASAAAAAAAAAEAANEPFAGLSQAEIDVMTASAVAAAVDVALAAATTAFAAGADGAAVVGPGVSQLTGGDGAADGPTDAEVAAWLGSPGAQALFGVGPGVSQLTGGATTVVINAPAVSGQEVVEAIGKYVDGNGPLPPHWQQGAN
jgi:hypothetical protein